MSTYGELTAKILDDLDRDDITSQAQDAIQAAIAEFTPRAWWFLEARATAQTVDGQEFFPLPDDYESELMLSIDYGNNNVPMSERTMAWMEGVQSDSSRTGRPTDYCIWDEQLRFYPVPDGAYTLTMSYRRQLPKMETSSASCAWSTEAFELIRRRAEVDLADTYLRDYQLADRMVQHLTVALNSLERRNTMKLATGKRRPYR